MQNLSISHLVLCLTVQLFVFQSFGQDDKNNWLKKQPKESGDTGKNVSGSSSSDSLKILLDDYLKPEKSIAESENTKDSIVPSTGKVEVIADYGIDLLNDSLIQSPPPIPGYRIQIFFGSLEQAKSARANFIRNHFDIACNIEQITPSFSVRAGNFRNQQEAYKTLIALKPEYPAAIIVSDNIDLPELPE